MARHTFTNNMIPHVWAQRDNTHGKGSTMSFEGDSLFSYGAEIARFVVAPGSGETVALLSARNWSITTSKHQSFAARAVPNNIVQFCISGIDRNPDLNLADMILAYRRETAALQRVREWSDWRCDQLYRLATGIEEYARHFGLTIDPALAPALDIAQIHRDREARRIKRETPAYLARKERERVAKEEAEQRRIAAERVAREQAIAHNAVMLTAWRHGAVATHHLAYEVRSDLNGGALLRVMGDKLETSMGVTVPLSHAIRVFERAKMCRHSGTPWVRNGQTLRVGEFEVDRLDADGTIHAGCHRLNWPEIEAAAIAAGVLTIAD